MKGEPIENLEQKICSRLSKKSPEEIGIYIAKAPLNIAQYICLIYLPKQSKNVQNEIANHVQIQVMKDNNKLCPPSPL